ncbi:MAG: rhomboid family intramembrane serine protease [Firmicutes bacterium]|nr:rhomboid family intramembrane serine protease [Bacillota bacterium]
MKIKFNSPLILGFVFLSLAAMILNILTHGASNRLVFMTYRSSLADPLTYVRFFGHVLGHAGWQHYIGNMTYILLLGPMLEEKYGAKRLLGVIALTALITGLVNFIFFPRVAICGASGVVFAFILMTSFTSFKKGEIPVTFILVAIVYLGQQVYDGLFVKDNISNMAHIVGGIVGAVSGYIMGKKRS